VQLGHAAWSTIPLDLFLTLHHQQLPARLLSHQRLPNKRRKCSQPTCCSYSLVLQGTGTLRCCLWRYLTPPPPTTALWDAWCRVGPREPVQLVILPAHSRACLPTRLSDTSPHSQPQARACHHCHGVWHPGLLVLPNGPGLWSTNLVWT
jgi:hypothetical protein